MQSYKLLQEEFNMPPVSLFKKLTHGTLDTVKAAKLLLQSGSTLQDVILLFNEMYLQKRQEYVDGELCSSVVGSFVCSSFAVLDAINLTLMKYPLKARFAAEIALQTAELSTEFFCDYH